MSKPKNDVAWHRRYMRPSLSDEWMERAACTAVRTDLFYPAQGDEDSQSLHAKRVCDGCPVKDECLDFAIRGNEKYGIWGGKTYLERLRIRKKWKAMGRLSA